jgi:replicative DNA helicase
MSDGVLLPADLETEMELLATMIVHDEEIPVVIDILRGPDDFFENQHRIIYDAFRHLAEAGQPATLSRALERLRDTGEIVRVNARLTHIVKNVPVRAHIDRLARRVRDKARLRQVINFSRELKSTAEHCDGDVQEYLDAQEQALFDISQVKETADAGADVGTIVRDAFEEIQDNARSGRAMSGATTGFRLLDSMLTGMHPGDDIVIAGRPGMGKTALAMNVAVNLASTPTPGSEIYDQGAIVFTLEMPKKQIGLRMVASEARVSMSDLRSGRLSPREWENVTQAGAFLKQLPIYIDDTPAISVLQVRARARRIRAQWQRRGIKLALVVIDYLQLMRGPGRSREEEVSCISRNIKATAKEFEIPIIAVAQLNRAAETRSTKDKRPQLSDLRESGAIEQDADVVLFPFRESYYDRGNPELEGKAQIIVAKQRNGETGPIDVAFLESSTRFDDLERTAAPGVPHPSEVA